MQTPNSMECLKKELSLEINSFDKPKELDHVNAWSQLLLNLIFLKPGTYPSIPNMGVGIEDYQYDFLEEAVAELSAKIVEQQKMYLPDVPLKGVNVTNIEQDGHPILIIQLSFILDESPKVANTAIAVNLSPRHFLDFEVSW